MPHRFSTPTSPPAPRDAAVLGSYRLVRRIGKGASSQVFEAEHTGLARRVAIKVLWPELIGDKLLLERMRFEAQVLARLNHPNILTVTDFGRTEDGRRMVEPGRRPNP